MLSLFDDIAFVIPGQDENLPEDRLGMLFFVKANAEKAALWELRHAEILRKEAAERKRLEEETGQKIPPFYSVERVQFYLGVALSHVTGSKRLRVRGEEVHWDKLEEGTEEDDPRKLTRRNVLLNMGRGGSQIDSLLELYVAICRGLSHEEKKAWRVLLSSALARNQSGADVQSAPEPSTTTPSKSSEEE